jgi:multiple sugar transport system permease protein
MSSRGSRRLNWLFVSPATLFVILAMVFPIIYTVRLSFQSWSGSLNRAPRWVGFDNYSTLLADGRFLDATARTVLFTVGAVAVELILGLAIALLLERPFRGRGLARTVILLPLLATPVAIGLAWLLMLNPTVGPVNGLLTGIGLPAQPWLSSTSSVLPTLMLIDVWQWTPMMTLLCLAGLATLPTETYEAAAVDGADAWQRFRRITVPLLGPTMTAAVLLRSIDALKTFDIIYAMTGGGPVYKSETLNIYGYITGFEQFQFGRAAAIVVVFFLIVLVFAIALAKLNSRWGVAR